MISATEANTSSQPNAFESPSVQGIGRTTERERSPGDQKLSDAEQRKLRELQQTDSRVKRHEEAHRAAAGSLYRGGPNYTYETGPDGKRYAVAGSVQIDTSPGRTPEETVQKASAIRRAALAPADPSGTDRAVAAKASRMESAARRAISRESIQASTLSPRVPDRSAEAILVNEPSRRNPSGEADASPQQRNAPRSDAGSSTRVLSPGDLGVEVWSIVSDLAKTEQLRQERRAKEMPAVSPSLDLLV